MIASLPPSALIDVHGKSLSKVAVPNLLALLDMYIQEVSGSSVLSSLHSLVNIPAAIGDARVFSSLGDFIFSFYKNSEVWRTAGLSCSDVLDAARDCFSRISTEAAPVTHVLLGEESSAGGEKVMAEIAKLPLRKRDDLQVVPCAFSAFLRAYELNGGGSRAGSSGKKNVAEESGERTERRRKLGSACNECGQVRFERSFCGGACRQGRANSVDLVWRNRTKFAN